MVKLIEALEARIRSLEEKLASRDSSDPVKSDPKPEEIAGMKKDVESIKEQNKKNESFNGFFQKVEVSGIVDGYYRFNSNRMDMFTQGRAFDVRHNAMELLLAKLTVERKNSTVYLTDKLTAIGNFVYGSNGDNDGRRGDWNGFAGYLKYSFNNRFAFSPRFEVLNDKKGLRTGLAQTIKEITLTQEMKLVNNFITRIEYRHDFSNRTFFTDYPGSQKKNEHTFIIGLSYFFSTREP